jgi:predicted nucleic acid-binding protein
MIKNQGREKFMSKSRINGFLLDTDFLIDLNRGKSNIYKKRASKLLYQINDSDLFISNVTIIEFLSGISEKKQENTSNILFDLFVYIYPTYEESCFAGRLRQEFFKKGISLSVSDVLNASLCINRNLSIVTRNIKHYPFKNINVLSW